MPGREGDAIDAPATATSMAHSRQSLASRLRTMPRVVEEQEGREGGSGEGEVLVRWRNGGDFRGNVGPRRRL